MSEDAFEIVGSPSAGGIVVVADHASNRVPDGIDLGLDLTALDSHIAIDFGVAGTARRMAERPGVCAFLARVSRLVCDFNRDEDILRFTDLVDFGNDGLDLGDLNAQIDSFYFDADFGVAGIIFTSGSGMFFNNQMAAISSVEDLVSNAASQIQLA